MNVINNIEVIEPIILIDVNSEEKDLIENYPNFIINKNQDQRTTKKNLIAELKKNFPKVKFSVKKQYYDCYGITWYESVTIEEVDNVIRKFIDHVTDVTGDFRDPNPSNFNHLFGGFKFIMTYREFGDSKKMLLEELSLLMEDEYKLYPNHVSDTLYRLLRKTSFPIGAKITGIKVKEDFVSGLIEDIFCITFD
jgi:hypothetical protein